MTGVTETGLTVARPAMTGVTVARLAERAVASPLLPPRGVTEALPATVTEPRPAGIGEALPVTVTEALIAEALAVAVVPGPLGGLVPVPASATVVGSLVTMVLRLVPAIAVPVVGTLPLAPHIRSALGEGDFGRCPPLGTRQPRAAPGAVRGLVGYFLFLRWMRVFFSSLRCFFLAIRLRRFLMTEPIRPTYPSWHNG